MSLILAIHEGKSMGKYLGHIFIVKHINALVLCECVVYHIHYDTAIVHHVEGINCRSDVTLIPPIQNYLDATRAPCNHSNKCLMLIHYLIYNLKVSFLSWWRGLLCKIAKVKAKGLIWWCLYVSCPTRIVHFSILLILLLRKLLLLLLLWLAKCKLWILLLLLLWRLCLCKRIISKLLSLFFLNFFSCLVIFNNVSLLLLIINLHWLLLLLWRVALILLILVWRWYGVNSFIKIYAFQGCMPHRNCIVWYRCH